MVWCSHIAMRPSDHAHEPAEPPEYTLWLMKRAWQNGHRALSDAVRIYDITPTQLGALNELVDDPGPSGAELARRLMVTPQAAQLAITALERRGLIERRPDPNHRRIVRTFLTSEGRSVANVCLSRGLQAENRYLAILDEDERSTLIEFLLRLAKQAPSHLNDIDTYGADLADSEEPPDAEN
jgi:DNA-binding MarR family transcriptional regulator